MYMYIYRYIRIPHSVHVYLSMRISGPRGYMYAFIYISISPIPLSLSLSHSVSLAPSLYRFPLYPYLISMRSAGAVMVACPWA